jgi:hypothetical protein
MQIISNLLPFNLKTWLTPHGEICAISCATNDAFWAITAVAASHNIASELEKFMATKFSSCKIWTWGGFHRFENTYKWGPRGRHGTRSGGVRTCCRTRLVLRYMWNQLPTATFPRLLGTAEMNYLLRWGHGTSSLAVCLPTSHLNDAS